MAQGSAKAATNSNRSSRWTYSKCEVERKPAYAIKAGGEIVATVASREDADMICRMKAEASRLAFDIRRHLMKIRAMGDENRMLLDALSRVAVTMKRSSSPELASARSEINKILRQMRTRGSA